MGSAYQPARYLTLLDAQVGSNDCQFPITKNFCQQEVILDYKTCPGPSLLYQGDGVAKYTIQSLHT